MADFITARTSYLVNSSATNCEFCQYSTGADYAKTFNLMEKYYAWGDTGITPLFCISSYAMVGVMMKMRSKATKNAKND
ncbi:uncharacterized protein BDW47DRAFT_106720 [Aspergillus candidus]|uniref:Uncharacterized protein n=1 Tax=Aspergillus candidus TaxID=41067 RepID=A0A2I2FA21_ASPCN|nr:hypothetical protein BDW47DRAFT_106720 [Aspergillus candidus]PLB37480.1 hypothetical protein BDW47DRAFT_106720 [Aspergillus candidus]